MKLSWLPKKARVIEGYCAWWYEAKGAITVYIRKDPNDPNNLRILSCSIKRSALLKYIERSKQ